MHRGSATLLVLSVLLALSIAFAGTAGLVGVSSRALRQNRERHEALVRLRAEAHTVVEALLADPTPFADSPVDPVWTVLRAPRADGVDVRLEDVSSRLGLNWVRKEVLADSGALRPGRTAQEVQQHREDAGLQPNLDTGYGQFIREEALEALFTTYGWFNVNVTDEFVLRSLHRARSGDPGSAERFHAAVQQARTRKIVIAPGQLQDFLGPATFGVLFPVVNAEPALNLHFVPDRVLEILFAHYHVPAAGARAILEARRASEVTPAGREQLLGGDPAKSPLAPYLGLRTWFWRLTVTAAGGRLEWIVARVPREDEVPEFRVVQERVLP